MDDLFRFKVGVGYWTEVAIWVEIPISSYNKVCEWIGSDKMARYEFGFHFQEILQEHFPDIDKLIHTKIDEWTQGHYLDGFSEKAFHAYSLISAWFEDL